MTDQKTSRGSSGALVKLWRGGDYEMTVTDPATFTRPVVLSQYWLWLPGVTLLPYECTAR